MQTYYIHKKVHPEIVELHSYIRKKFCDQSTRISIAVLSSPMKTTFECEDIQNSERKQ